MSLPRLLSALTAGATVGFIAGLALMEWWMGRSLRWMEHRARGAETRLLEEVDKRHRVEDREAGQRA